MKNLKICLLIFLISPIFNSCEKEEDVDQETLAVYTKDSFAEIFKINGVNATPFAFTDGNTNATNRIEISNFNNVGITSFDTRIAVPTDNTVSINATLESVIIVLKNGSQVSPFFAGGEVSSIIDAGDGVDRQEFIYNFTYPSNASQILIDNIDSVELVYGFNYENNSSGNSIHSKNFTHEIVFEGGN